MSCEIKVNGIKCGEEMLCSNCYRLSLETKVAELKAENADLRANLNPPCRHTEVMRNGRCFDCNEEVLKGARDD